MNGFLLKKWIFTIWTKKVVKYLVHRATFRNISKMMIFSEIFRNFREFPLFCKFLTRERKKVKIRMKINFRHLQKCYLRTRFERSHPAGLGPGLSLGGILGHFMKMKEFL